MKLKLIISNTFDLASTAALRRLNDSLKDGHNILIVPDKFSLSYEVGVLEKLHLDATFDVEIMSFTRFAATRLKNRINRCLTPEGSVMLLRRAIDGVKSSLVFYRDAADSVDFPREIYAVITSLRNSGLFPDDLDGFNIRGTTGAKLRDISLIYREYLEILEKNLTDSSTRLYAFADFIPDMADVKDLNIFIVDFYEFTAPQYEIIRQLIRYCRSVTIGLVEAEKDAANKRLAPVRARKNIINICKELGADIDETTIYDDSLPQYKKQILKHLFGYKNTSPVEISHQIQLYVAPTVTAEVERAARYIRYHVVNGGRYRDIALVVSDIEGYTEAIKKIFTRFNIPFYIDKRVLFAEQPAAKYILSALKCVDNGYELSDILRLAKNPYFYIDDRGYEKVERFENYCLKYSIAGKLTSKLDDEEAENLRSKILDAVSPFSVIASDSGLSYADALTRFALKNKIAEKCEEAAEKGGVDGEASAQVYDKFAALIDEMRVTIADVHMDLHSFTDMLSGVFNNIKIALVPLYLDSVYAGEPGDSRYDNAEIMFILGASDGNLPLTVGDTAVLGLVEESDLISSGVDIYPAKKDSMKNGYFYLTHLLLKHKKRLIVSYSENYGGDQVKPSRLIPQLSELFTVNGEKLDVQKITDEKFYDVNLSDHERARSYAYKFGTLTNGKYQLLSDISSDNARPHGMQPYDALFSLFEDKDHREVSSLLMPDNGDKENVTDNITLDRGGFSASQLETYYACPYKQYFAYALRIRKRKDGLLTPRESGTAVHAVMEKFIDSGLYKNCDKNDIKKLVDGVISDLMKTEDFKGFNTVKHMAMFNRIKKESAAMCVKVAEVIAKSDFKPQKTEAKIGEKTKNAAFDGLTVKACGKKFIMRGSIDRIDAFDNYYTVVDYKSSKKNLTRRDIFNGTHIQPLLYAATVAENGYGLPAGMLYQPLIAGFKKDDDRYRMKGIIVNNEDLLHHFDTGVEAGEKSDYYPFSLKKDGTAAKNNYVYSDTDMTGIVRYAEKMAGRAVTEIAEGYIKPSPADGACKYCDYSDICPYQDDDNLTRKDFMKIAPEDFIKLYNGEHVLECGGNDEEIDNE